jgi:hypothetical protein
VSACRSCGAEIWWAYTAQGRRVPLDADPTPSGNLYVVDVPDTPVEDPFVAVVTKYRQPPAGAPLYQSHFASCPQAAQHRRPR